LPAGARPLTLALLSVLINPTYYRFVTRTAAAIRTTGRRTVGRLTPGTRPATA